WAAAVVLLTLLGGIVGTTMGLVRAQLDRDAKELARQKEEQERTYAQAIADFVKSDFLALTSVEGQDRFGGTSDVQLDKDATLQLRKAKLGADHPDTLASMSNLAVDCRDAGKLDLALPLLEEALKLRQAKQGADHPDTLKNMNSLALGYQAAGKLDLALPLFQ